MKTCSFTHSEP